MAETPSQPLAEKTELQILLEENDVMRREIEALLQAKEIAREKVRSAIQELVEENKRLKTKLAGMETQMSSLVAERNALAKRLQAANGEEEKGEDEQQQQESMHRSGGRPIRKSSQSKASKFFGAVVEEAGPVETLKIEEEGLLMWRNEMDNTIEVRGGTLEKLVLRLLHEATPRLSPEFITDFILTHRSFTTTDEVLTHLIKKYHDCTAEVEKEDKITRLRICTVLELWAELQGEDLAPEEKFLTFVKTRLQAVDGERLAQGILRRLSVWLNDPQGSGPDSPKLSQCLSGELESTTSSEDVRKTPTKSSSPRNSSSPRLTRKLAPIKQPKPLIPRIKDAAELTLDDIEPVELARQMTLLDYALFQKIRPSEYNNVAWTKKNKEIASPNLLRFIRRFNDVSIWVQNTILSGKSAKKRAALVDNFAKAAVAFRKLNNFNGVMQIVSAMEGAAVHRLQKTFERVRPKSRTKYAELLELMSSSGSYKFYREALAAATPPIVPYMGMYLTDLMTLDEVHKNMLEPSQPTYINFTKRVQIASVMKKILEQQSADYALQPIDCIQEWFVAQLDQFGATSEDALFSMSLVAEPREG